MDQRLFAQIWKFNEGYGLLSCGHWRDLVSTEKYQEYVTCVDCSGKSIYYEIAGAARAKIERTNPELFCEISGTRFGSSKDPANSKVCGKCLPCLLFQLRLREQL